MGKVAIITGVGGQDGSYLTKLLLRKKYKVIGLTNPNSKKKTNFYNIDLKKIDLNNFRKISELIKKIKPDEFYHLAAQSFINYKFEDEFFKLNPNINGTHYILSAIKKYSPKTKFYFAASSEIFGNAKKYPQNENSKFNPRSAYGISKVAGFHLTKNYREAYNLFSCSGILYNHESPIRNSNFVSRKITSSLAKILIHKQKKIILGDIDAKRDWGYAGDYVEAMWKMLQQKKPNDFVIGTGITHSVKDFLRIAFKYVNLDYKDYIKFDKKLIRPKESVILLADSRKAKKILKWKPKTTFKEMIHKMIDADIKRVK
jgi:GDPmannose 4,6-dehydratase